MAAKIRLTYSVQRQLAYSVRTPPSSRPIEPPAPAIAPKMPNALARSTGSVKVVVRMDRMAGARSAANAPWTARAPISMPPLTAAPPMAEATAKPTRPTMNTHLRPSTSEMRPPSSSNEPNASAYAVTIHWRALSENPRSACAVGSAMVTMVASRTIISWAMPRMARIHQRFEWLEASPDAARVCAFCSVVAAMKLSRNFPEMSSPVPGMTLADNPEMAPPNFRDLHHSLQLRGRKPFHTAPPAGPRGDFPPPRPVRDGGRTSDAELLEVDPGQLFVGPQPHPEPSGVAPAGAPAVDVGDDAVEGVRSVEFHADRLDLVAAGASAGRPGRVGVDESAGVRVEERLVPGHAL